MMRRLVALGLLVVLLVLTVAGLRAIAGALGGDTPADAAPTSTDPGVSVPDSTAPASDVTGVETSSPDASGSEPATSDPGSSDPAASPPADSAAASAGSGPPTAQNPAVVYIAGDSDAGTFGPYLKQLLAGTGLTTTTLDYKVSSGLARPDFYDWPARFREQIPAIDPDIVVVTFGGNDAQPIAGNAVDSDAWRAEYGARVGAVMDHLRDEGRTLIWVGIPNASSPDMTARMAVQDAVVRAEAAKRPDVVFIDTWKRFSGRNGGYAEFVIDPRDGEGKDVRASDGFHLNENGAEILALDIAAAVQDALRARGAAI